MFGKTRRYKQDAPAGGPIALPALSGPAFEPLPVAGAQSDKPNLPPARRGVFGRMGAYFTPERLSLLASAFSSDPDAYGSERERQYTMRTAAEERRRAEQEMEQTRRTAKDRNEELRGFINQAYPDDPEGQRLAWLSPQSAVTERLRNRQGPEFGAPETISGRLAQRNTRTGEIEWAPQLSSGGAGGVTYHPPTPDEVAQYGLPGNGAGFVVGSNGLPRRVGGGGTFSADQRARVAIGIDPAIEAVTLLDEMETGLTPEGRAQGLTGRRERTSPRNQEWGASLIDMVDGEGASAWARNTGGESFQRYSSAAAAFEAAMLPILSGAAVTPSEAQRTIRAALPQLGDGHAVLTDKARRRQQMVNGAALIGGRDLPYPEAGIPDWAERAQRAVLETGGDAGGVGLENLSDEDLDALEQELLAR